MQERFRFIDQHVPMGKALDRGHQACECLDSIPKLLNGNRHTMKFQGSGAEPALLVSIDWRAQTHANLQRAEIGGINREMKPECPFRELTNAIPLIVVSKQPGKMIYWRIV